MARLKKGASKKLKGQTTVVVEKDLGNGLVVVNIGGAFRIVSKANLK